MASNMKAVKLRIKSVQSTMQITKAMELVASSKLRKAKERAEVCRPYFTELHETLKEIARENTDFSSVYAKESSNNKTCYVVIAGDRGLAGGYNANLFKCLEASAEGKDYMVLPVGKKAVEYERYINRAGDEEILKRWAEEDGVEILPEEALDMDSLKKAVEGIPQWLEEELISQGYDPEEVKELIQTFREE